MPLEQTSTCRCQAADDRLFAEEIFLALRSKSLGEYVRFVNIFGMY